MTKPITLREADFKRELDKVTTYPDKLKQEFFEYWTEPNKSNTKMRFELEKTWHLSRRLARWASNGFNKETGVKQTPEPVVRELTELDKVDEFLMRYKKHPTTIDFSEFGKWYQFLKDNRLLKSFTAQEIDEIRSMYSDNYKCRCVCVMMTFDTYANSALSFKDIMNARKVLQ